MSITMEALPYEKDALEPYIGSTTVDFHFEKHHKGYFTKLMAALSEKEKSDNTVESIMLSTDKPGIYNLAAQIWNHDFYWKCLSPEGGGTPPAELAAKLDESFGSVDKFIKEMTDVSMATFGSGWSWLVKDDKNALSIISTSNAENPLSKGLTPLFTIDVWEHAYYLDYQNKRNEYVDAVFANLINWKFIESNLKA